MPRQALPKSAGAISMAMNFAPTAAGFGGGEAMDDAGSVDKEELGSALAGP